MLHDRLCTRFRSGEAAELGTSEARRNSILRRRRVSANFRFIEEAAMAIMVDTPTQAGSQGRRLETRCDRCRTTAGAVKIKDIDNPETFQRLVHAVLTAEHGADFHVVDDSGGDLGNDGYLRTSKSLFAVYCPEKRPSESSYKKKILDDLAKAVALRDAHGYEITTWVFVTPANLREQVQRFVRDEAAARGFTGVCMGDTHLTDLFLKHTHLHNDFIELVSPKLVEAINAVGEEVRELRDHLDFPSRKGTPKDAKATFVPNPGEVVPSAQILSAMDLVEKGQLEAARTELDRLRLESSDPNERLWAIILATDCYDALSDPDRILLLTSEGIPLAQSLGQLRAMAILKAERGRAMNVKFVFLDIQTYTLVSAGNATGLHMITAQQLDDTKATLHRLQNESYQLLSEAVTLARDNRLYRELCFVLPHFASALTMRAIFYKSVPSMANQTRGYIDEVRRLYEAAIRIASAMEDPALLANLYHNYANDLRSVHMTQDARIFAQRAKELADKHGLSEMTERATSLLEILGG